MKVCVARQGRVYLWSLSYTHSNLASTPTGENLKFWIFKKLPNTQSRPFWLTLITSVIFSLPFSPLILPPFPHFSSQCPSHTDPPTVIKKRCASAKLTFSCKYFHSSNSEHICLELSSSLLHMLPIREHNVLPEKVYYSDVISKYLNYRKRMKNKEGCHLITLVFT